MRHIYKIISIFISLILLISMTACRFGNGGASGNGDSDGSEDSGDGGTGDIGGNGGAGGNGDSVGSEDSGDGDDSGDISGNGGAGGNGDSDGSEDSGDGGNGDIGGNGGAGGNGGSGGNGDSGDGDDSGDIGGNGGTGGEGTKPSEPQVALPTPLTYYDYANGNGAEQNSELFYRNSYEIALGDPTVLYVEDDEGGVFYVTGTTTGMNFQLWKTRDFSSWESLGTVYTPPEGFFGVESFWAPQLLYDPDADWQYYLGEDSEPGKGLYILSFSARRSNGICNLAVSFSTVPEGPYVHFSGVNANGDYIDESNSCFEIEKLKGLGLYEEHPYGALYKENRGFIDASPYIDPVSGDKYLYMVRNRWVDTSNDVWGVKMKDWVSPDYSTTTPLTANRYTTPEKVEPYGYTTKNNIDEGPFLYYKDTTDDGKSNGKYYLTFSVGDTNDKLYPVCQAVGDTPLGPFEKIQPENGGFIICPGELWDIHSSGHHAFFEAKGELFVAYHTYIITEDDSIGKRFFGFDKVEWVTNGDGQYLMRANGPSKTIQPLPEAASEYKNLAPLATVTVMGDNKQGLTDGLIPLSDTDIAKEFIAYRDPIITMKFDRYITARAILIYNSYTYERCFDKVEKIELSYRIVNNGKICTGTAYISELGFSLENNLVPESYLAAKGETSFNYLRPLGAAAAEFDELEINALKIYLKRPEGKSELGIGEIIILGKEEAALDSSTLPAGVEIAHTFKPYTAFIGTPPADKVVVEDFISLDGALNEEIWQECKNTITIAGVTTDQTTGEEIDVSVFGEREAKVYTYISDTTVYFAFEVTDKNLYLNTSLPQGRSTCVELYFTSANQTVMKNGCYSVRINPTGLSGSASCNLGTYIPNSAGNEWNHTSLPGMVCAVSKIDGRILTKEDDTGYSTDENRGYIVEIAIDKSLIGDDSSSIRFTAAFVQDQGYNLPRLGNSFIEGTHYTKPSTWIVIDNEGIVT